MPTPLEDIAARLALGPSSASELTRALRISQPTVSRALQELERNHRILRMGTTRGARYALLRPVGASGSQWPVFLVDEEGTPHEAGRLHSIERDSYYTTSTAQRIRGLFEGVPYYLQDARPAGFLGRAMPTTYPELELPPRVVDWTDEHFLSYLTRRGADTPGNLIVGTEALDRHLEGVQASLPVAIEDRATRYPELAIAALGGKAPGSSAYGEQPKFTACIAEGSQRTHVIVKFSPPRSTPAGQRWADLLTAEYLAHRTLAEHGLAASPSSLLEYGARVFLQCERFDRVGAEGRRGCISLLAIDVARYGKLDNWTACADRLAADSMLSARDASRIRFLDAFGALIGNTDRHFGNITLFDRYEGPLDLAPVYDMLPMLYAPENDQLVDRQFEPPMVRAAWLSVWPEARALAEAYWQRLVEETAVSAEFRQLCARSLAALQTAPLRGARTAAR